MDFTVIEKLLVSYFESHPQVVEQLITAVINAVATHLQSQAPKAA